MANDDERLRGAAEADTLTAAEGTVGPPVGLGMSFGRYRLDRLLGTGGMGAVFAAHDPELDRTVAVKVLLPGGQGAGAFPRLRIEAQIMARLSHPNVLQVYDVGEDHGQLFVAMEYITGGTLGEWLDSTPRSIREILAMFALAGRGLAATHDDGLVHRDFKPSNVLVGADGQPRVSDFGVARSSGEGGISGTPLYMAPEQHAGQAVDARADQFAFCMALWQGLHGAKTFSADTLKARAEGRIAPPSLGATVPAHVQAALQRGLAADPEERFSSMQELLAALDDAPGRRRRRRRRVAAIAASLIVLAAGVQWGLAHYFANGMDPCAARTGRFASIWDDAARARLHQKFITTGAPYAASAFDAVARLLDTRAHAWEAMRRESCRATKVEKRQSELAMDQRGACLERAVAEVGAFVDELDHVDKQSLARATDAVNAVGDVSPCADAATLGRVAPQPGDPAKRRTIAEAQRDHDELRARLRTGRTRGSESRGPAAVERARLIGWAPLYAEALALAAQLEEAGSHLPEAVQLYERALLEAEAGSDDLRRFDSELHVGRLIGYELEREHDGLAHLERAEALRRRLGNDPNREAQLLLARGMVEWWNGHYPQARATVERAVKIFERLDPKGYDVARAYHLEGIVLDDMHEDAAALAMFTRARALTERIVGPNHPTTAKVLNGLSGSLRRLGREDEAKAALERAQAIFIGAFGPVSIDVANTWANLANLHDGRKEWDAAIDCQRKSLALMEKIYGPDNTHVADELSRIGSTLSKQNRSGADEAFARALAIQRAKRGPNDPITAELLTNIGEHDARQGRHPAAIARYRAAIAALEASVGAKNAILVWPLQREAESQSALGKFGDAIATFERALALAPENDGRRPEVELGLAKVLRDGKRDPARALPLARRARARYAAQGPSGADGVKSVDAWLAAGRRP